MRTKRLAVVAIGAAGLAIVGAVVAFTAGGGGPWTSGWQMMGGRYDTYRPAKPTTVKTLAAARADAQRFASRLGLRVGEVLQFKLNFYAKLVDSRGNGATEVLVDPSSGLVSLEYGPAMMWNTRYGMMNGAGAGMMGSYGYSMMGNSGAAMMGGSDGGGMMGAYGTSSGTATGGSASLAAARTLAQRWLNANEPGVSVETGGDSLPGYYTLETLKGGKITGMISVNATTGTAWPHWWHGVLVAKPE